MMNRRSFLGAVAATVVAQRMDLFGREHQLSTIGMQLYTVRNQMQQDFEGTIGKVAAIGYKEVEFAGYFNHTPEQVKGILDRNNLKSPSTHIPLADLRNKLSETIETSHKIGHEYIIMPWVDKEGRGALDSWKKLAAFMNETGKKVKEAGLQLGYHNHNFEFKPTDGQIPYDVLLAETDPNLVKMEMDLRWITSAGHDPLQYFNKYPGRFPLVHVKDMPNKPNPPEYDVVGAKFTEVGRGTVNFKRVFAQADKGGVQHYLVEQDETAGSPFDSLKVSYDYLKQLRF
jgi:sugar phosphate isomerase/epimerase